ncbi:MAG: hypothetical protein PHV33_09945 [Elusimicrobiales bacterium]|nr:hypothetical protein [Elusimicrobiales bacterium]
MGKGKILFKLALSLLLLPGLALAAEAPLITQEEAQLVQACSRNIDTSERIFSPEKAQDCVRDLSAKEDLLERASQVERNTGLILLYNNSLVSLGKVCGKYKESDLGYALVRELETKDCYPCLLGLGPRPEKIFGWVDNYLPDRGVTVRRSLRTWTSLSEARRSVLQAEGLDEASWNAKDIRARYEKLSASAQKDSEALLDAGKKALLKNPDLVAVIEELKQDLIIKDPPPAKAYEYYGKLNKLMLDVELLRAEPALPPGISSAEKKELQLKAANERLAAARGAAAQKGFLDQAFDNYVPGGYTPPPTTLQRIFHPGKYRAVDNDDAAKISAKMFSYGEDGKLKGYLASEISGTKAGDQTLAFYNTPRPDGRNKLDFAFDRNKPGNFGTCYYKDPPYIRVNTRMIEDYARQRGVAAADILKDEKLMQGLASYIAPTFVHEAAHHRQEVEERTLHPQFNDGMHRTIEREVEAFGVGAAFTAEKMQKAGPAYAQNSHPHAVRDAEIYLEDGVEALRARKHTYDGYRVIDHTDETASARILASGSIGAREAAALKAKYKDDPDLMTAQERTKLKEYLDYERASFAAARYRLQRAAEAQRRLDEWREGLLDADSETRPSEVPRPK